MKPWFGLILVMDTEYFGHGLVEVWSWFGCVLVVNKEYFGHALVMVWS